MLEIHHRQTTTYMNDGVYLGGHTVPKERKADSSLSRLNIILREPEQILLIKACIERLSKARGGVKISAIQALLDLAKLYLENADQIDPVSNVMMDLMEKKEKLKEKKAPVAPKAPTA